MLSGIILLLDLCDQFGDNQIWVRPKAMFHETIVHVQLQSVLSMKLLQKLLADFQIFSLL